MLVQTVLVVDLKIIPPIYLFIWLILKVAKHIFFATVLLVKLLCQT